MKISTLTATTAVTAAEAAAKKLLSTPMMKMMFTTNYLPVDRVVDLDDVIERVGHAFEQHHDSTLLRPFVIPSDAKINMLKELNSNNSKNNSNNNNNCNNNSNNNCTSGTISMLLHEACTDKGMAALLNVLDSCETVMVTVEMGGGF